MGYRNEVVCVLKKEAAELINKNINNETKHNQDLRNWVIGKLNEATEVVDGKTGDKLYYWENTRWDPDDILYSILQNNILTNGKLDNYLFISVGDDIDDITVIGFYYDNPFGVYLKRSITYKDGDIHDLKSSAKESNNDEEK